MKRLLLITSSYPLSPEETFNAGVLARELALGLQRMGYSVWVVTPRKNRPIHDPQLPVLEFPWWGRDRELASQTSHPLNWIRFASLLVSGMVFVDRVAATLSVEACVALWAIPSGALAYRIWRRRRIPYGVWALGSDIWGRHRYPLGGWVVRRVLQDAAFRLADGWHLAREVERISGRPCGFLPAARRLPLEIPPAMLPPARFRLLYVGRFERQKGVDLLAEALCALREDLTGVQIHMLGDGTLRPWVEKRLKACGLAETVFLHGYAVPSTVVSMMKAADYLVIPSRVESIPLVFGDAMQCGLPVVATDVGDLGMLIRLMQVGWVVGEPTVADLTAGLRWVLSRPDFRETFRRNTSILRRWFRPEYAAEVVASLLRGEQDEGALSIKLLGLLGDM
jgi:glycosyltransferase involved in cell wall biosynthesis